MSARLEWAVRWRLSLLWVLEWGITGAILTYFPIYFAEKGLSVSQLGQLMAVSAVGLWVAPFVVGQICDRWMATEKYLTIAHALGGAILLAIPAAAERFQQSGDGFGMLLFLVGLYAAAYFPTIPLASSLTFRHLPFPDKQFGQVRIWGTVGWVLAGLLLSFWLGQVEARASLHDSFPRTVLFWDDTVSGLPELRSPLSKDSFYLGAVLSFSLAGLSFLLPATPPLTLQKSSDQKSTSQKSSRIAAVDLLAMFKDRTFSLLIGVSFLLAVVIPLYSLAVPKLLEQLLGTYGLSGHWVPAVMTVGQISEFPALLLLPWCVKRFGMKRTFAFGMLAWVVRYGLFAVHQSFGLMLLGIGFHGVCHVFLVIVIQLYVDAVCRDDLRASAQNLFAFVTMGIAMPVGFVLAGWWGAVCLIDFPLVADYFRFFMIPAVLVLLLLIAFWVLFTAPESVTRKESAEKNDGEKIDS